MKYEILTHWDAGRLESLVENYLTDGWKPCGGVSVCVTVDDAGSEYKYAQAVVKEEA